MSASIVLAFNFPSHVFVYCQFFILVLCISSRLEMVFIYLAFFIAFGSSAVPVLLPSSFFLSVSSADVVRPRTEVDLVIARRCLFVVSVSRVLLSASTGVGHL